MFNWFKSLFQSNEKEVVVEKKDPYLGKTFNVIWPIRGTVINPDGVSNEKTFFPFQTDGFVSILSDIIVHRKQLISEDIIYVCQVVSKNKLYGAFVPDGTFIVLYEKDMKYNLIGIEDQKAMKLSAALVIEDIKKELGEATHKEE